MRIGVAVGNSLTATASPLEAIGNRNGTPDWPAISRLIEHWQPNELIVGLPLTIDGEEQIITAHVKGFIKALKKRYDLPVQEADERFSSVAAQKALANMRASGQRKRRVSKGDIDSMAATLILQGWFTEN